MAQDGDCEWEDCPERATMHVVQDAQADEPVHDRMPYGTLLPRHRQRSLCQAHARELKLREPNAYVHAFGYCEHCERGM